MNRKLSTIALAGALALGAAFIAPAALAGALESAAPCALTGTGSLDASNMGYNPEQDNVSFNQELDGLHDNLILMSVDPQLESSNVSFNRETGGDTPPIFIGCPQ
jgi:hypothetical protein